MVATVALGHHFAGCVFCHRDATAVDTLSVGKDAALRLTHLA